MYSKKDFKITLPSVDYLENSKLIKKIGLKCTDLNDDLTDYWAKGENEEKPSAPNVTLYGQITLKSTDSQSGVRLIIQSKIVKDILKHSSKKNKNGLQVIEFGKWYSPNTVQLKNPIGLSFTSRCYPVGEKNAGLEFENSNGRYVLYNDRFHPVVPIKWYYDEKADLLLSVNSLFYSARKVKLYGSQNIIFSLFDILDNQVLPLILDSENDKRSYDEEANKNIQKLKEKQKKLNK